MIKLRPYQQDAVNSLFRYFEENTGNPLVVIPTGGGKSLILADFIRRAVTQYPGTRILVVTHVKELISQNHQELLTYWPIADAGLYSAGLRKRDTGNAIIFAGIQSIHNKAYDLQFFDLILIDEAHLVPAKDGARYRTFIRAMQSINPDLKIAGFTATPFRLDSGMLHEGEDAIFTDICYEISVLSLIGLRFLCPPISIASESQIDTSRVHSRGGEFMAGELEHAAMDPSLVMAVAAEIVREGDGRKGWLVFGCGVKHCAMLAGAIREYGVSVDVIFGGTPPAERDRKIKAYERQETRCLVSMGVLTTGFNARHVDLIAVVRATKSTGLWIQIVGRGTRLFPGKSDFKVLDYGGNIPRHGPIDAPIVKSKPKQDEPGEAPTKDCAACGESIPIGARACPACGASIEFEGPKVTARAGKGALLTSQIRAEWAPVTGVSYAAHSKAGSPDSLRVTYQIGLRTQREWICIGHTGFAREKAVRWWQSRTDRPAPFTAGDAIAESAHLRQPKEIQIKPSGKFTEITGYRF
ncbi:MAG: DEAD/DEAH box helicase [Azospirillum sp.]|nr:DEAD/DEAH box helicase [Azospirillum sp.]